VLNSTSQIATPVAIHHVHLLPTRDPRHAVLSAMQIAAIRALVLTSKDGAR
jgi:hypothetical protein